MEVTSFRLLSPAGLAARPLLCNGSLSVESVLIVTKLGVSPVISADAPTLPSVVADGSFSSLEPGTTAGPAQGTSPDAFA